MAPLPLGLRCPSLASVPLRVLCTPGHKKKKTQRASNPAGSVFYRTCRKPIPYKFFRNPCTTPLQVDVNKIMHTTKKLRSNVSNNRPRLPKTFLVSALLAPLQSRNATLRKENRQGTGPSAPGNLPDSRKKVATLVSHHSMSRRYDFRATYPSIHFSPSLNPSSQADS